MSNKDGMQYDTLLNGLGNGLVSEGRSSEPDDVMTGSSTWAAGIETPRSEERSSTGLKVIIAAGGEDLDGCRKLLLKKGERRMRLS